MENASKALMIAAEVLIGILILTFAVYLVNIFGQNAKEQEEAIFRKNLTQFNEQFTKYETPTNNITAAQAISDEKLANEYITSADVVTLINLAKQKNNEYANNDQNSMYYITVRLGGVTVNGYNEDALKNILNNSTTVFNGTTIYKRFSCTVKLSNSGEDTGRVREVLIKEMF